jgi:DNA-directed RNA polymerase subunit RPC12/RpoP
MGYFTPEQAIAATLGSMSATVDDVLSSLDEMNEQGRIEYADYSQLHDAIAAMLGGGECEYVIEDNMNESDGMGDVWFRCTNCDTTFDYYADDWLMKQDYCPHCGFKIRKVVNPGACWERKPTSFAEWPSVSV